MLECEIKKVILCRNMAKNYENVIYGGIFMKQLRKNVFFKNVVAFMLAVFMALSMNVTALADNDASPAVATAREGVLQINLVYEDSSGQPHPLKTGSGFLIGASSGATTVITNYHVVSLNDEEKTYYTAEYGVDFYNANNINLKIQVVVKRDVVISASYVNGSEKTDFAILELAQAIYDRTPLKLADSDKVMETQRVFALGFPFTSSVVADDQVYTSEDVTITNGIVGKFQNINEIGYILHDANLDYGNSGGPLVDSNGNVIGVNTLFAGVGAANYYYSIAIDEIADVLSALGIVYETADESTVVVEPESTAQPTVPTQEQQTIEQHTSEQPESTEAISPVIVPSDDSVADSNTTLIIIIVAAVIIVVILVVVIVAVISGSKKKKVAPIAGTIPPVSPMSVPGAAPQQVRPTPPAYGGNPVPPMPYDSGAGETSVLGGGAGETSVLSANMQPTATLVRKKNGESVSITKALFTIGKERAKVDFCIPDNNSISRNHANIICKGGIYYLVDKNSTNYTFVNGNKITPNQEVKLNSGDKIRLADEEFEFRL